MRFGLFGFFLRFWVSFSGFEVWCQWIKTEVQKDGLICITHDSFHPQILLVFISFVTVFWSLMFSASFWFICCLSSLFFIISVLIVSSNCSSRVRTFCNWKKFKSFKTILPFVCSQASMEPIVSSQISSYFSAFVEFYTASSTLMRHLES